MVANQFNEIQARKYLRESSGSFAQRLYLAKHPQIPQTRQKKHEAKKQPHPSGPGVYCYRRNPQIIGGEIMKPDDDWLHKLLRHTIRIVYGETQPRPASERHPDEVRIYEFRGMGLDEDTRKFYRDNPSPAGPPVWGCFDCATQLCTLLVGSDLVISRAKGQSGGLALAEDTEERNGQLSPIKEIDGYVVVRFWVVGEGAGHSYIFLSTSRVRNSEITGFIYQSNIGGALFDVVDWIDDPKSEQEVELGAYCDALLSGFRKDTVQAYRDYYMLQGSSFAASKEGETPQDTIRALWNLQHEPPQHAKPWKPGPDFQFNWGPVNCHRARLQLTKWWKVVKYPPVAAAKTAKLTVS